MHNCGRLTGNHKRDASVLKETRNPDTTFGRHEERMLYLFKSA